MLLHTLNWMAPAMLLTVVMLGRLSIADTQQTPKTQCRNIHSVFSESTQGWQAESSLAETFSITPDGLRMKLVPPVAYERLTHKATTLPYNSHMGHGPTLNSTTYMHYGILSAVLKSSRVGGVVTALIMIADNGDEIDLEMIGSEGHTAQTNYFYGKKLEYTVNGGAHTINGTSLYDDFHNYTIDWTPERIVWYIDDMMIRVKHKNETCNGDGVCEFPSSPARIQLGFWDGSFEFGTAEWAHGPIDWEKFVNNTITSYIKEMSITCNTEYNEIVDHLPEDAQADTLLPTSPKDDATPTKWKTGNTSEDHQQDDARTTPQPASVSHSLAVSNVSHIPHNFLAQIIFVALYCII